MAKYLDKIGLSYFWSLIKSKLIPAGGQQGQVLAKASAADDDVTWVSTGVNNLIGDNLVAASNRQIVIGQYNEADSDENAIIVGNGTDDTDRQNTFKVSRDGDIDAAGGISYNGDFTVGGTSFDESRMLAALNCRSNSFGFVVYDSYAASGRMIQVGARVDNPVSVAYGHDVSLYANGDGINLHDMTTGTDYWRLGIHTARTELWPGTKVITVSNASSFTLFTKAQLQAIVGTNWTPTGANCAVFIMNGEHGTTDALMTASIDSSSVVRVHMNKNRNGAARINYLIVRFAA